MSKNVYFLHTKRLYIRQTGGRYKEDNNTAISVKVVGSQPVSATMPKGNIGSCKISAAVAVVRSWQGNLNFPLVGHS